MRGHFCFHCQREWLDQSENQRERPKKQKIDGTQPPPPSFDIDRIDQWGARIKSPTKSGQAIVFDARPPMKTSRPAIGGQWRPLNQTTKKKNNRKAKKNASWRPIRSVVVVVFLLFFGVHGPASSLPLLLSHRWRRTCGQLVPFFLFHFI